MDRVYVKLSDIQLILAYICIIPNWELESKRNNAMNKMHIQDTNEHTKSGINQFNDQFTYDRISAINKSALLLQQKHASRNINNVDPAPENENSSET